MKKLIASILLLLNSHTYCLAQFEYFPPEYSTSADSFLLVWNNLKTDSIKFIRIKGFESQLDSMSVVFENRLFKAKVHEGHESMTAFYDKEKNIAFFNFKLQSFDNEQLIMASSRVFIDKKGKKTISKIKKDNIVTINKNDLKKVDYIVDNKLAQKQANKINLILFCVVYPIIVVATLLLQK
jgi:hypothetical protein